jgi:hypothetical protein
MSISVKSSLIHATAVEFSIQSTYLVANHTAVMVFAGGLVVVVALILAHNCVTPADVLLVLRWDRLLFVRVGKHRCKLDAAKWCRTPKKLTARKSAPNLLSVSTIRVVNDVMKESVSHAHIPNNKPVFVSEKHRKLLAAQELQ